MNTDAIALRAFGATAAGVVLVALGLYLMNDVGAPSLATRDGVSAFLVLVWGLVGLGAMSLQAGLVGFVIVGSGARRQKPARS
jgi:hypothetical protein